MTISTARATSMTVSDIVLNAYRLAGLVSLDQGTGDPTWTPKLAFGRTMLSATLAELAAWNVPARYVSFETLTLTADDPQYTMPVSVFDLLGDGAYLSPTATDPASNELTVKRVTQDVWQGIANKASTGSPTLYYAHRGATDYQLTVYLWPVPSEAGSIRFLAQRYNADALEGSTTIDLETYWHTYVLYALAYHLAMAGSLPGPRCNQLAAERDRNLERARGKGNLATTQPMLDHPTGWSNR